MSISSKPVTTSPEQLELASLLTECGLKVTRPRLSVLKIFKNSTHPISVQEVAAALPATPTINGVTLYRIVEAFKEKLLVREVNLRHGHLDYELIDHADHHHHIVCTKCGLTEDLYSCGVSGLIKAAIKNSRNFATVNEHSVELFGLCKKCIKL